MKVFIVLETSWEYSTIRAVCSTKRIAYEYMAEVYTPPDSNLEVEEWTIDG